MSAMEWNQDSTGRIVLKPSLAPRLAILRFTLVWLGFITCWVLVSQENDRSGVGTLTLIAVMILFAYQTLSSILLTNQVMIDPTSRTVTTTRRFLGIVLNTTAVPFSKIANVEHEYYLHKSGRRSHRAWRVNIITRDHRRIPINWDGKQDEMAAQAYAVAALTVGHVLDHSTEPAPTAQQVLDSMRGWTNPPVPVPTEQDILDPIREGTDPAVGVGRARAATNGAADLPLSTPNTQATPPVVPP